MNHTNAEFIDEKEFLEDLIETGIPLIYNVFSEIDVFGKISSDNNIKINFKDPTIVLSKRHKKFKRRFIAYSDENNTKIDSLKLPITLTDPHVVIPMDNLQSALTFTSREKDVYQSAMQNFTFKRNGLGIPDALSIELDINVPYYRMSFDKTVATISDIEKYEFENKDKVDVYLITLELDFSDCTLNNIIFNYAEKNKKDVLKSMVGSLGMRNEWILLMIEHKNLYKQIEEPIEYFYDRTFVSFLLDKPLFTNRDVRLFWNMLRLGIDLDINERGKLLKNTKIEDDSYSYILMIILNNLSDFLVLSIFSKPNYSFTNSLGISPITLAISLQVNPDFELIAQVLLGILCGANKDMQKAKKEEVLVEIQKYREEIDKNK